MDVQELRGLRLGAMLKENSPFNMSVDVAASAGEPASLVGLSSVLLGNVRLFLMFVCPDISCIYSFSN